MDRLSLAQASKRRVRNRLDVETKDVGNNEWALSQALTWIGSHEKAISFRNRPLLISLGTGILEKTLDETLRDKGKVNHDGTYGLVLPKDLRCPAVA